MVEALSGNEQLARPSTPSQRLTSEQLQTISDTLSNFDADSLSEEDAQSIVESFKDAGIKPGKEMADAVSELGFDAKEIGDLAGIEGPEKKGPPPPKPEAEQLDAEALQQVQNILEGYDLSDLSEEEEEEILTTLRENGLIGEEGDLLSVTA